MVTQTRLCRCSVRERSPVPVDGWTRTVPTVSYSLRRGTSFSRRVVRAGLNPIPRVRQPGIRGRAPDRCPRPNAEGRVDPQRTALIAGATASRGRDRSGTQPAGGQQGQFLSESVQRPPGRTTPGAGETPRIPAVPRRMSVPTEPRVSVPGRGRANGTGVKMRWVVPPSEARPGTPHSTVSVRHVSRGGRTDVPARRCDRRRISTPI